jgi:hypothetical protein
MMQYLGPTIFQLAHLFILVVTNSLVLFALILLTGRTIWSMSLNMTTIEGWEIERHETLLRRARTLGGRLDGPDGNKVRIEHQEFPWDIGIWTNLCEMMGSRNPLVWFWPFAKNSSVESGLQFEHNGIDGMYTLLASSLVELIGIRPQQAMATARSRSDVQGTTSTDQREWLHPFSGRGRLPEATGSRFCSLC